MTCRGLITCYNDPSLTYPMHIRTKWRVFLSLGALGFASTVLGVSLFSTHMASAGFTGNVRQELSFDEDIIPGHVLYPIVMTIDRVQLEIAPPSEKLFLEVEYADRRLAYAKLLLEQDRSDIALTTVTKAEKYLQQAARSAMVQDTAKPVKLYIIRAMQYHQKVIPTLASKFNDPQRAILDKISAENLEIITLLQTGI